MNKLKKIVINTLGLKNIYFGLENTGFLKPKQMILDISAACNAACPFCPRLEMDSSRMKGYMSFATLEAAINEAKKFGIKDIRLFSSAEPLLHPEFDKIINILKENNFFITISTNASTLDKHMDALAKVDIVQFSIEGWDKETYEKYRYPLKFDETYKNIVSFWSYIQNLQNRPQVNIHFLVSQESNVNMFMNLWADYVDKIRISPLMNTQLLKDDQVSSSKNIDIESSYFDSFEKKNTKGICSYPFTTIGVSFDGKITLCCLDFSASMDLGNIHDGIKEVFYSEKMKKIRDQFYKNEMNTCAGCNVFRVLKSEDKQRILEALKQIDNKYSHKLEIDLQ